MDVELIDPLTAAIPASWDVFVGVHDLPASLRSAALAAYAWMSSGSVRLALVHDPHGVVAIIVGEHTRALRGRDGCYPEAGDALPTGFFFSRTPIGFRPGIHFRHGSSFQEHAAAVAAFERAYRSHAGLRRCLGFIYERVGQKASFAGHFTVARASSPSMVLEIGWDTLEDYLQQLTRTRRRRFTRLHRRISADSTLELSRDNVDPVEASALDLHVRDKYSAHPRPLAPSYLSRLQCLEGVETLCYRDSVNRRALAFDVLVRDGQTLMAVVHGSLDPRAGGHRDLHFHLYLREIAHAIHHGFDRLDFGPGMPEVKSAFGARPVSRPSVLRLVS